MSKVVNFRKRRTGAKLRGVQLALDKLGAPVSPSLALAKRFDFDESRYTTQERAAASHALDFNGTSLDALTFTEQSGFPGFSILGLLGQLAEYRTMHEVLADDMTRTWGFVKSTGATPPDKVEKIEAELLRIDAKSIVRQSVIHNEAFGGSHIFFSMKDDAAYRQAPLVMRPETVPHDSFIGLRVVEPFWVTPNNYNSIDPTAPDFYRPKTWWMLGVEVHASRLQTVIPRPVADMLKPMYSFRGLSMTQLAMPYVDNWLRTRQSVSDTVKQFSITGVLTDLQTALHPGAGADLVARAELFNQMRDIRNIAFLDKNTEEFFQVNTPLSGLDALQAQSQEQMSSISRIPLVKLLGITPTGLNASSEGEFRVYYDYVRGYQTNCYSPVMANVLRVIQLSLFGEIDDSLTWEWAPLQELTALENADRQKIEAETASLLIESGVVSPEQEQQRQNNDQTGLYAGALVPESVGDVPDDDIAGLVDALVKMPTNPEPDAAPGAQNAAPGQSATNESEVSGAPGAVSAAGMYQLKQTGTTAEKLAPHERGLGENDSDPNDDPSVLTPPGTADPLANENATPQAVNKARKVRK